MQRLKCTCLEVINLTEKMHVPFKNLCHKSVSAHIYVCLSVRMCVCVCVCVCVFVSMCVCVVIIEHMSVSMCSCVHKYAVCD